MTDLSDERSNHRISVKPQNIHWAGRDEQVFGRNRWETSVVCTEDRKHTAGYVVRARTTE